MNNLIYNIKEFISSPIPLMGGMRGALSILLIFLLQSCSEDLDVSYGIYDIPEGYIALNLAVPDPVTVSTRAVNESAINNLDIFIFNENGDGFYQYHKVGSVISTDNKVYVPLNNQARNNNVIIYAVANVDSESIKDITSIESLRKYLLDKSLADGYLPMIGFSKINTAINNTPTISLYRSVAKISASVDLGKGDLMGIQLYNNSSKGFLGSAINTEDKYKDYVIDSENIFSNQPSSGSFNNTSLVYTYPSKGGEKNDLHAGAYLIVKVKRDGSDQYYRLNLRREVGGELTPIEKLEANHHYAISITGFMTDGYATPEEAAEHPESDQFVGYTIHDHALEILSMVTDGYRELGVSPGVVITLDAEGNRKGILTVKCYDPDNTSEINENDIKITIKNNKDELLIGSRKSHTSTDIPYTLEGDDKNYTIKDDPNLSYDKDNQKGKQYDYELSIPMEKKLYEDMSWDLLVEWHGLQREVKVSYEAAFLLPQICTTELTILKNDDSQFANIKDYWTFITGEGTYKEGKDGTGLSSDEAAQTPQLYGIRTTDMTGEKKRTGGFHFPMPYGETGNVVTPWSYKYTIDFSKFLDLYAPGGSITGIDINVSATSPDNKILSNETLSWEYDKNKGGTLIFIGDKSSYQYAGGNITFIISYKTSENVSGTYEIVASLYHTGFFHYENDTKYVPTDNDDDRRGYYYYEVVPMGDGYWLDRNICASSNQSFIDITDDNNVDRRAAGLHYTIIKKQNAYKLPEFDFGMCPPGYHVPNEAEWDAVRLSTNFVTRSVIYNNTVYMSTYYVTNVSKIGNIYLQKARFVNGNNIYSEERKFSTLYNNGDAGAGYYWSVTEAPAMEKEQMGNWLRALYLNGSASSYTNASVTDHRMPVRCKAGTSEDATVSSHNYISFNVHEVTHIYLVDTRSNPWTPLYTFPGKAVGTTQSAIKWQHFYCSTTVPTDKVRALFVKLEKDGKVTIYTRKGTSFENNVTYDSGYLTEDKSWSVLDGAFYDFCSVGADRGSNYFSTFDGQSETNVYPTDCITVDDSDPGYGGGGSGEQNSGNFEWDGYESVNWSKSWDGLSADHYDWTNVESAKIWLTLETYYSDAVIRLYHKNPDWQILNGLREYSWNDLGRPDYNESTRQTVTYGYIELTSPMIQELIEHDGLMVGGNNYGLKGVKLEIKEKE